MTEKAVIGADLVINILSTLLLGASNHAAQLLCAPTRGDIDSQHARGYWLDIGVSSVRNLRYLPRWRTVIWMTLLFSTVPLHLLYVPAPAHDRATLTFSGTTPSSTRRAPQSTIRLRWSRRASFTADGGLTLPTIRCFPQIWASFEPIKTTLRT